MVVTAGDEAKVRASVEFLKWFTLPENNISFSVGSGYMPVTKAANNIDTIKAAGLTLSPVVEQVLTGAVATINENRLYTPLAFEGRSGGAQSAGIRIERQSRGRPCHRRRANRRGDERRGS